MAAHLDTPAPVTSAAVRRRYDDGGSVPALRLFVVVCVGLVAGEGLLALTVGRGPVLAVRPWLGPTAESFAGLAAVGIAFLCLGRYRVLSEPASFWIGLAFAASATLVVSYVVYFPGIFSGQVAMESYSAVQSWSYHLRWTTLCILLLVAAVARRPASGRSSFAIVAAVVLLCLGILVVGLAAEGHAAQLPPLFAGDHFTSFNVYWKMALTALFVLGALLSLRRFQLEHIPPVGYASVVQLIAAFITGVDALGGQRWDLFWYINRALLVGSYTFMLFALLAEYVGLYRRQGELTRLAEQRAAELGATFESMADAVYVLDSRAQIVNANQRAVALMGFRDKEDALRPFNQYQASRRAMHLDGTPLRAEEFTGARALGGETVRGHVERVRLDDGSEYLLELSGAPIRDADGHVAGAVVVLRDVTELERARAQEAVARVARAIARELELAPLLEIALGAVAEGLGADAVVIYRADTERRELRLLGQRNLPASLADAVQCVSFDEKAPAARALAMGELQYVEDVGVLPSDHVLAEELRRLGGAWSMLAVPLVARGQAVGVLDCLYRGRHPNSPEQLEAITLVGELLASGLANSFLYEEAQAERRRLGTVIDNSPEGIVLFEAPSGYVVLANAAAERIMGRAMEHDLPLAEHARVFGLFRPNGTPCPIEELPLARALQGEIVVNQELLIRQPDGREVATMQNAAPIRAADGSLSGVVLLFQDISQLKQLERQREEFTSIVTHDLRAPLSVIVGHGRVLQRLALQEGYGNEASDSVDAIWVSAKRLEAMIKDLSDVSRLDSRRLSLEREPVSLVDLSRELIWRMDEVLRGHPVELETEDEVPLVHADPLRIEQVLANLLLNAAKYSPEGSPITVRVFGQSSEVIVEVIDRGPGIPPDQLSRLFRRFYRTAEARKTEGLGLGLYIAKGLVEAHGGRIWVTSRAGEGTVLHLALPESEMPSLPADAGEEIPFPIAKEARPD